jgi:hypothetical protein
MVHMLKGRTVENERKWQEKPSSPSPSLIDSRLHLLFCFRHFYLSAFCPFDQSRIYRKNKQRFHVGFKRKKKMQLLSNSKIHKQFGKSKTSIGNCPFASPWLRYCPSGSEPKQERSQEFFKTGK